MQSSSLFLPFPWFGYSDRLLRKIDQPYCAGKFSPTQTAQEGVRLVEGKEFHPNELYWVTFYWLVDQSDGVILDARFQAYGASSLIGAAQVACELLAGKNYIQAQRLNADHIDQYIRDRKDTQAFPNSVGGDLNLVIDALSLAALQCQDISLGEGFAPPTPIGLSGEGPTRTQADPQWVIASYAEKLQLIERVLDEFIRPYVALDEGGIEIVKLIEEHELIIRYQGSCTSCASSTGSTLFAVQEILREHLAPNLVVVPDLTNPSLHHH